MTGPKREEFHSDEIRERQAASTRFHGLVPRLGAGALALLLAASLTGCGKKPESETAPETQAAATEAPETQAPTKEPVEIPADVFVFNRENFPVMDGSTSLAPLGQAVASVLLRESRESAKDLVNFNKTTQSYRNLMNGECELILASEPNAVVFDEMKEQNFTIEMEPISTEALVFVVNESNPVDNLTTDQIRGIYSGTITNWKEVGGEDLPIQAFQRNSGSGSQALMSKLVMGDLPMAEAPAEYMISGMGELMEAVKNYDNSADAIGYSVYYYANDMRMADGLKIIAVDGVEPSDDTIRSEAYPHTNAYFCAISGAEPEDSPARLLYNWMVSPDGQKLVSKEGYVSVAKPGDPVKVWVDYSLYTADTPVEERYSRLTPEWIPDLVAGEDYGTIYPYIGSELYGGAGGYTSVIGYRYGVVDASGQIIADPTYQSAALAGWYDWQTAERHNLPFWLLGRADVNPSAEDWDFGQWNYTIASLDGSYVSDQTYSIVHAVECGLILGKSYEDKEFLILDLKGNVMLDSHNLSFHDRLTENGASSLDYGDGLFTIRLNDGTYFMDLEGNLVMGPYPFAEPFHNGRSIVSSSDWSSVAVIEKETGREIVPMGKYVSIGAYNEDGYSLACLPYDPSEGGSHYVILNLDGKAVWDQVCDSITIGSNYFTVYDSARSITQIYDMKGNLMKESDGADSSVIYGTNVLWKATDKGVELWDIVTGVRNEIETHPGAYVGGLFLKDSMDETYKYLSISDNWSESEDDYHWRRMVLDAKTLQPVSDWSDHAVAIIDPVTEEAKVAIYRDGGVDVLDPSGEVLLHCRQTPDCIGNIFRIIDDGVCRLVDEEGRELFCHRMTGGYGD